MGQVNEIYGMDTPAQVTEAIARLRHTRAQTLAAMPQAQVVEQIARWAEAWQDPHFAFRHEAERLAEPFPFSHVRVSLDGLLPSLAVPALNSLIDAEGVRDAWGAAVVGHVVAGNTPLLAWTSVLRALLMRSASFVKVPSGPAARWAELFVRSLEEAAPGLASCIVLAQWPGGTEHLDAALCEHADLVMCHGGDNAVAALHARTSPGTPFVGYGHALSFGLVLANADEETAADGLARDVLVYAQGGCLSAQTVLVLGDDARAARFGQTLADALRRAADVYPAPPPSPQDWERRRTAQTLGQMQPGASIFSKADDPFVVLAWPRGPFHVQDGTNIVTVQSLPPRARLDTLLGPLAGRLQGCALAGSPSSALRASLGRLGISRLCAPGELQAPPLGWRQNGRDVLRVLREE